MYGGRRAIYVVNLRLQVYCDENVCVCVRVWMSVCLCKGIEHDGYEVI